MRDSFRQSSSRKMVYDDGTQGQGEDCKRCNPARTRTSNTHVQFFRIQRSSYILHTGLEEGLNMVLSLADTKVVYRRYASLFFVCGISQGDNELVTLEIIHRYVEVLDRYFGNVSASLTRIWVIASFHLGLRTWSVSSLSGCSELGALFLEQDIQLPKGICCE